MWFYSAGTNVPLLYEMISKDKADKHQIFQNALKTNKYRRCIGYNYKLYSQSDSMYIAMDSFCKDFINRYPSKTMIDFEEKLEELSGLATIINNYEENSISDSNYYTEGFYDTEVALDTLRADTTETYEEQKEVVKKEEPVAEKQAEASVSDTQKTSVFATLIAAFVLIVCVVVWAIRRRKQGRG
jgi:hypothetical protein